MLASKFHNTFTHTAMRVSIIALCALLAIYPPLSPATAQAATSQPQYGYLWELVFDFDEDFNGVLKLQVGPWENGDLVWVEARSESVVECTPSGQVSLSSGYAIFFNNGHLQCTLDIAQAVLDNHDLVANATDTYGSFIMQTKAILNSENPSPIFNHPDAKFRLEGIDPIDVSLTAELSNGAGLLENNIFGIMFNTVNTYTVDYVCTLDTQCDTIYGANDKQSVLTEQGAPITFATGPTAFNIGKDDTGNMRGRIDQIFVDPGNFVHKEPGFSLFMPIAIRDPE